MFPAAVTQFVNGVRR